MHQNINMHGHLTNSGRAYMNGYASHPQNVQTFDRTFNPYMNQGWNPMMNQHYPGYYGNDVNQQHQAFGGYEQSYFHPQNAYKPNTQNVFQNPLHQQEEMYQPMMQQSMHQQYMNPYPKQSFNQKKQGNFKGFMNSFKSQDGSLDFNKMLDTAGMMMNAMNQVTGVVKGVGGIFKV
ncbi:MULTISPECIES: YppG family protein [Bacillaceae]|uniref:YppG family protein n=1 Tax=Bacillaceae TaxID=186817 RepID=UPI001E3E828A|nr:MULTISPECIES: YppG family protein [Bacillaceae]MCE4047252.1 YppG family protein [Bacillus sp. Au-Bac7]MCM3031407.1 YppG family protein [Niallia sp. MER 6]MDL0435789.1 YppG family protein [Niallia sp. SS-2023]UPO86383.1 YppG family protein [Niallia sp. Man26]